MRRAWLYAQQVAALAMIGGGTTLIVQYAQRFQRWGPRGPADLVEAALFGLLPPAVALVWSLFIQRGLVQDQAAREERAILDFALRNGGMASALTASVATGLPIKRTDRILRELQRAGHAELDVGQSGGLLYRFPALDPAPLPAQQDPLVPHENQARAITRPGLAVTPMPGIAVAAPMERVAEPAPEAAAAPQDPTRVKG